MLLHCICTLIICQLISANYLNASVFSLHGFGKLMSVIRTANVKTIATSYRFPVSPLLTRPRGCKCVLTRPSTVATRKSKTFSYWSFLWKPTHLLRRSRWPCVNTGPWPYLTIPLTVTSPAPVNLSPLTVCVRFWNNESSNEEGKIATGFWKC